MPSCVGSCAFRTFRGSCLRPAQASCKLPLRPSQAASLGKMGSSWVLLSRAEHAVVGISARNCTQAPNKPQLPSCHRLIDNMRRNGVRFSLLAGMAAGRKASDAAELQVRWNAVTFLVDGR